MIRALLYPRLWLALALAGLLAFTHYKAFTGGKAAVQAAWTADKLATSEAARQREKALTISNQGVDRAYQIDKKRRAAAERRTADSLRDFKAAVAARPDSATTNAGADTDPRPAFIAEFAAAAVRLDSAVKELEGQVLGLQAYVQGVCLKPQ